MSEARPLEPAAREVFHLRGSLAPGDPLVHRMPDGRSFSFQVLGEVELSGQHYAILRTQDDHPDDAFLYRIHAGVPMEIEDDNEWETVAEAVDEMLYFHDSQS